MVLVGLPGAGKSTVGRLVAERLRCPFIDFDAVIAEREGRTVPAIFADSGEAEFRRLEAALTAELAARPPMVMAPGGGWMAQPDNRRLLGATARVIHLRVGSETALARLGEAVTSRPLLTRGDPAEALERLSRERMPFYYRADAEVNTEGIEIQEVTAEVLALATRWGWPVG